MKQDTIPPNVVEERFLALLRLGMVVSFHHADLAELAKGRGIVGWLQDHGIHADNPRIEVVYVEPMIGPVAALVGVPRDAFPARGDV